MLNKRLIVFSACLFAAPLTWAESLFVFVPSEVRANIMQENITKFCPGVDTTVFGRAKDFRQQVKTNPPNAILTLLPVIERNNGFNTIMKGTKNGLEEEDYVLVSVGNPIDLGAIKNKKIGVVDLLGRKPMNEFVGQLLQTDVKVKRVTKVEDLLPLLTFGSVDGIFVSESLFTQLKSKSNQNLVATRVNVKVGLVSAALNNDAAKDKVVSCISRFDAGLNGILGVEKWRAL